MNLEKIDTETLAELVGILLGDGYLSSSTNRVKFQLNGKNQLRKWIKLVGFSNKKHKDKIKRFL